MTMLTSPRLGWHRDLPDPRDYTPQTRTVGDLLSQLKRRRRGGSAKRPTRVDLREYCSAVADQQGLKSCTAHACVGLVEYFERRSNGLVFEGSPLFLYKVTRRLLDASADSGANLRVTLKALVRFGLPPERHWPYDLDRFEAEPDPFVYGFDKEFQSVRYVRLDPSDASGPEVLRSVKSFLAAGFASVFGFSVPASLSQQADIAYPTRFDAIQGGQAAMAVGYDDNRRIRSTKGALLVRNSWGTDWGEQGYGWLPFRYVEDRLAADFWTLLKPAWLESGEFERPA